MDTTRQSYVIGSTDVTDPAPLGTYVEKVPVTLERFGGQIRAAGTVTALEGDAPTVAAVIEFPSAVAAASWYDSPEYEAIRGLRQASGTSRVWLVEPPPPVATVPVTTHHPNLEIARRGYDAFARGDVAALTALLDDALVWHVGGVGPLSGSYVGLDAVTGLLNTVFELTGGSQRLEVEDIFAGDDYVVGVLRETATRARDGACLDVREAHVMRVAGGKVVEFWDLPDDPAAHDAFFS